MHSINSQIAEDLESVEQKERQHQMKQARARKKLAGVELRRKVIVGELVIRFFPELLQLYPRTIAENKTTFAHLERFLAILAEDELYLSKNGVNGEQMPNA